MMGEDGTNRISIKHDGSSRATSVLESDTINELIRRLQDLAGSLGAQNQF